jgi:hypothetical protein
MLLAGRTPRIAPVVLIPGKQHRAGMPSPHQGERAFVVPRAVTAFTQQFAPMTAVLTLVSGADQNAIGSTPHEQIRLPGSAVDVPARWVGCRQAAPMFMCLRAFRCLAALSPFHPDLGVVRRGADEGGRVGLGQGEAPGR